MEEPKSSVMDYVTAFVIILLILMLGLLIGYGTTAYAYEYYYVVTIGGIKRVRYDQLSDELKPLSDMAYALFKRRYDKMCDETYKELVRFNKSVEDLGNIKCSGKAQNLYPMLTDVLVPSNTYNSVSTDRLSVLREGHIDSTDPNVYGDLRMKVTPERLKEELAKFAQGIIKFVDHAEKFACKDGVIDIRKIQTTLNKLFHKLCVDNAWAMKEARASINTSLQLFSTTMEEAEKAAAENKHFIVPSPEGFANLHFGCSGSQAMNL